VQKTSFHALDPGPGNISAYADVDAAPGTDEAKGGWHSCKDPQGLVFFQR